MIHRCGKRVRQLVLIVVVMLPAVEALAEPYRHEPTALTFPDEIDGLRRTPLIDYEAKYKGLGIGIAYHEPGGIRADVYIYSGGYTTIVNGAHSAEVLSGFRQAEDEIYSNVKKGEYERLEKRDERFVRLGDSATAPEAAWASYAFHYKQRPLLSHLYVTGYRSHLVKIRLSFPEADKERGEAVQARFVQTIGRQLAVSTAVSPGQAATADRAQVLAAIQVFITNPLSAESRQAASVVVKYAEESDDVKMALSAELVPVLDNAVTNQFRSLLLAAYIVGNTQSQLERNRPEDDPYAGTVQMIRTYQAIKKSHPRFLVSSLEQLLALERDGGFRGHIENVLKKQQSSNQKK